MYLTETVDAVIWGAELARGDAKERIYIVKPTGDFEDDPNVTDKKLKVILQNHIEPNNH